MIVKLSFYTGIWLIQLNLVELGRCSNLELSEINMRYSYGVQAQLEWLSMLACRGAGAIALWNDLSKGKGCNTPHHGVCYTPPQDPSPHLSTS